VRGWKTKSTLAITTIVAALSLMVFVYVYSWRRLFATTTTVHQSDALAFYRERVEPLVKLPKGARIVQIVHRAESLNDTYILKVSHPGYDRSPGEWMEMLWMANDWEYKHVGDAYRSAKPPFRMSRYDASSRCFIVEVKTDD
jgi:hypothetical protein